MSNDTQPDAPLPLEAWKFESAASPEPVFAPLPPQRAPVDGANRRRAAMFVAAVFTAIALGGWLLAIRGGWIASATGPEEIVRAQIQDIGNDRFRAAYELFSFRYRSNMSFDLWRDLVMSHRGMFRTRELRFGGDEGRDSRGRAVLEAHVVAESGTRYVAQFTLIHAQGRWWIDDIHWGVESEDQHRSFT